VFSAVLEEDGRRTESAANEEAGGREMLKAEAVAH
jgi:hypothetical protein